MFEINLDEIDLTKQPPATEPERQYYFVAKAREKVIELREKLGRNPSFHIQTFGCPNVWVNMILLITIIQ